MARLRDGPGQHRPSALPTSCVKRGAGDRSRPGAGRDRLTVRADSRLYAHSVRIRLPQDGCSQLLHHPHASTKACTMSSRPYLKHAWTPIPYCDARHPPGSVAETTYIPFQSEPDPRRRGLIVRRVKPTPGSQLALFATYSYHGFITWDRDGEMLDWSEPIIAVTPRSKNAIRDLKYRCRTEPHAVRPLRSSTAPGWQYR